MDTEKQCETIARLYVKMAKDPNPIFSTIWGNAAKRWWFYRRVVRKLRRGLRYDETDKLCERCCPPDLTFGHIAPEGANLIRKLIL